jgi:hypothetical protein
LLIAIANDLLFALPVTFIWQKSNRTVTQRGYHHASQKLPPETCMQLRSKFMHRKFNLHCYKSADRLLVAGFISLGKDGRPEDVNKNLGVNYNPDIVGW